MNICALHIRAGVPHKSKHRRGKLTDVLDFHTEKYLIHEDLENSGNNHDYSYHTIFLKYCSIPTPPSDTTNPPGRKSNPASMWPGR